MRPRFVVNSAGWLHSNAATLVMRPRFVVNSAGWLHSNAATLVMLMIFGFEE